ncbi:peptidoglycan-associated lipoprotein Pal [Roseospirillum parvum]|uniref:Peptidoglycan-associated lipoprotein n=1 Tax=Roseospirillum parvum TaxID=83401 RepID=A0A1G7XNK7_9PROT|nr:peptidoglycan-associated lipoprotein Pal [Roseospirillum parvum]SDG85794.1 peptidoglycan-associated lipoprotein [Roseospirillum parvum]
MKLRFVSVVAAATLLAACSTGPEEGTETTTGGTQQPTQTQQTTTQQPAQPSGPVAGSVEEFVQRVGSTVYFDLDQSSLKPDGMATLRAQAEWLKRYPGFTIRVEGNCDERGTREYNLALGERRANSAREYLIAQGVDPNRVETVSYGKERPVCVESTESCWARNRNATSALR